MSVIFIADRERERDYQLTLWLNEFMAVVELVIRIFFFVTKCLPHQNKPQILCAYDRLQTSFGNVKEFKRTAI